MSGPRQPPELAPSTRTTLSRATLRRATLRWAPLRRATLRWAPLRRATPVVVLVRGLTAGAAFVAMLVAWPAQQSSGPVLIRLLPGALVLATGVGLFPRSRWVGVVAASCVLEWVAAGVVFGDPPTLPRVGLIAALLYTLHAAAAFAAVLPYDCVVAPGVLARWAGRQALLLAVGLGLGLGGLALARLAPATPTLAGPVVGAALAAGLAGILAVAWHRHP